MATERDKTVLNLILNPLLSQTGTTNPRDQMESGKF